MTMQGPDWQTSPLGGYLTWGLYRRVLLNSIICKHITYMHLKCLITTATTCCITLPTSPHLMPGGGPRTHRLAVVMFLNGCLFIWALMSRGYATPKVCAGGEIFDQRQFFVRQRSQRSNLDEAQEAQDDIKFPRVIKYHECSYCRLRLELYHLNGRICPIFILLSRLDVIQCY